jgi:hypothetical protein
MIDASPSLEAAEGVSAIELGQYLVARGWTAIPARTEGVSIFSKELPGADGPVELVLPNKEGFRDANRRVADALRTVAQIEGRSESAVAEEVRDAAEGKTEVETAAKVLSDAEATVPADGFSDSGGGTKTSTRARLARHAPLSCGQCGQIVWMPEWTEYLSEHRARHLWTCDSCGYRFETVVAFQSKGRSGVK